MSALAESLTPLNWTSPIDVVVTTREQADLVGGCLDALAGQRIESPFAVTVLDRVSDDGSADIALRHPLVNRVALCALTHPLAPCQQGGYLTTRPIVAFIDAAFAPDEQWVAAGVACLIDGADVAVGPDGPSNDGASTPNLFLNRGVIQRIGFILDDGIDAFYERAALAGFSVRAVADATLHSSNEPQRDRLPPPRSTPSGPEAAPDGPLVSVVVCTRGRPASLARCLDSLVELGDGRYEVIVVDNSVDPTFADGSLPLGVRHVHEPCLGLDIARNRGVREAAGEIVAFIDDDCTADRDWIAGVRATLDDPSVDMVAGRVIPAALAQPSERWFEAWFSFDRGPAADRFTWHDRRDWFPLWTGTVGTGCNMAFRRKRFLEIARFDPALDMGTPIGGGGDLDIFAQYLDNGAVIAYAPEAVVRHYHRDSPRALRRQFFGYSVSVGALCIKYMLHRRHVRRVALRFYFHQLRMLKRAISSRRQGRSVFPLSLLVLQVCGQLVSPIMYLRSRARARRMEQ